MASKNPNPLSHLLLRYKRRRRWKRLWSVIKNTFRILLFLLVLLYVGLQNKHVQNWLIDLVTDRLSSELQTTVEIQEIDFRFFNKLDLNQVYIEDFQGDTLLFSDQLTVSLSANLIDLLNTRFDIDDVYLRRTTLQIRRRPDEPHNNLKLFIDHLFPKDPDKAKNRNRSNPSLVLDIDRLFLEDLTFSQKDEVKGTFIDLTLPEGMIEVDAIDIQQRDITIGQIQISDPIVRIEERPRAAMDTTIIETSGIDSLEVLMDLAQDSTNRAFGFDVHKFKLERGIFKYDHFRRSPERTTPPDQLDFNHLHLFEIEVEADSMAFRDEVFEGAIDHIHAESFSGFELRELSAKKARIAKDELALYDFRLRTPESQLSDTLVFTFDSWDAFQKFEEEVRMDVQFDASNVTIDDVLEFAPNLRNNPFFDKNAQKDITIDGRFYGTVANPRGRDLYLRLGDRLQFYGSFNGRNLTTRQEEGLSLKVENLSTSVATLRDLIPNFIPPPNFDKLGKIKFDGRFDGFLVDFVAYGNLITELGKANVDMRMNLRGGRNRASYSGVLNLIDFDLRRWSDNDNFGMVTLSSQVKNSTGLTIQTVDAELEAVIDRFDFRGYQYQNAILDAQLNQNLFDGTLRIADDNINLKFNGTVDYSQEVPTFDFDAKVDKLDLFALNLSKDKFTLSGDIVSQLRNDKLSDLEGELAISDLLIIRGDTAQYRLDSISLQSSVETSQKRHLRLHSEIVDLELDGFFDLENIPSAFQYYLNKQYPEFARRLKLKPAKDSIRTDQFDFLINIYDSKNFTTLLDPKLDTLYDIYAQGNLDLRRDSIFIDLSVPRFKYDKTTLREVILTVEGGEYSTAMDAGVYAINLGGKNDLDPLTLRSTISPGQFDFELNATSFSNYLDNLNIMGRITLDEDDRYRLTFLPTELQILSEPWTIAKENFIVFGKNYLNINQFKLESQGRYIALNSYKEKGVELDLDGMDLHLIDKYWDYKELDFFGKVKILTTVDDVFALQGLETNIIVDTFNINGDDWGRFFLEATTPEIGEPIQAYLSLTKDEQQLLVKGNYTPPNSKDPETRNAFDFTVALTQFPLYFLEYWIGSGVTNTLGFINGNIKVFGVPSSPNFEGEVDLSDGAVTINYLQTRYYFNEASATLSNTLIDVSNETIMDELGNRATIYGGITHDRFRDFGVDARIIANRFLVLNTTKNDNELYYGRVVAQGDVRFSGSFKQTNIDIDVTSLEPSRLIIPISNTTTGEGDLSYITLRDPTERKKVVIEEEKQTELRGVNVDMNITITPDADVQLIIDERAGDVVKGTGFGNLQVQFNRTGEFNIYGDYTIQNGEYLFTLYNFINKPFVVKEGGLIRWDGDPYDAQIDIEASYIGLNTAPYNFIVEYLSDDNLKAEARATTRVDLRMFITGRLLQPDISFELSFPNLTGELRNYVESKLRAVRQDQAELNFQVGGLLLTGNFLPNASATPFGDQRLLGINTLSEFIENQISLYLTSLLSEVFTDVGFISGVDFNINYNIYETSSLLATNPGSITTGQELEVRQKFDLFDDRLSVNVGGNLDLTGTSDPTASTDGAYIAGDVVIEYQLTKNRRFKVRFYQRTDNTIQGRQNKRGLGFSYRREFDSFSEFLGGMQKSAKTLVEPENQ